MVQLSPDQHGDALKSTLLTGCCRSISGSKSYSQSSLPPQASNLHICDLKLLPSIIKSTSPITINIMTMSPVIIVDKFPEVLFGDVSQPCHSCCRQGLLHNLKQIRNCNVTRNGFFCHGFEIDGQNFFRPPISTMRLIVFVILCFNLETRVHEPGHLKDVNQVQDVWVVMFHALKGRVHYQ